MWTHDVGTGDVAVVVYGMYGWMYITSMDEWMYVCRSAEGDWSLFIIICNNYTA